MTISVSDNTPRVSYSVSEGATQTSFTVSFEFFADADLNVYVDGTKKTLTTHYSVTGGDGSTGSISMSVTGASGGSTVVITRGIALERTTDFPVSGAFAVGTLNTELDRFVAIQADLNDTITRSVRLQDDDSAVSMELPLKAARLGTVLGFNASTGAAEAGPTIANVNSLSAITANINTVAGISANVTTVAGIHGNVTTVAGISSNVTTVAGISSNVTTVAGKASLITSDFAADMALIDSTFVTKMNLVTSDFVTDMAAVTSDFISDLNTLATSDIVSDLNTLATSDIVTDLNLLATSAIVEDLNLLATSSVIADMATLAGSGASPNITSVTASGAITAGSFVIGSADINENDLEAIDGVTAGTVAASKAVVVDTNRDISSFRNLTATGEVGVGRLNLSSAVSSGDLSSDKAQVGYASADGLLLMGQGSSSDVSLINDTGTVVARIPTGTNTLQVLGAVQSAVTNGGILYLTTSETTVVADDSLGSIQWSATGEEAPDGTAMSGAIECTAEGTFSASANPTQMLFKLGVSEAATTKMTLASNGNLTVTGALSAPSLAVDTITIDGSEIDASSNLTIDSGGYVMVDTTTGFYIDQAGAGIALISNDSGNNNLQIRAIQANKAINFVTNSGGSVGERMRITSGGNVGIGNTDPEAFGSLIDNLVVGTTSGNNGMTIVSGTDSGGRFCFSDNTSSPQRGMIEYDHPSDSMLIATAGTQALKIDSTGAVTKVLQPAFSARVDSDIQNLTIGGSDNTHVVFGSERFDQNSDYNASTGVFTAPVTGKYVLSFTLRLENIDTATNSYDFIIFTSNVGYQYRFDPDFGDSDTLYYNANLTVVADMDANDTANVEYYVDAGTAQTDIDANSYFMGYLLG